MCWLLHASVVVDDSVHVCYWHAPVCVELLFAVVPNLCDVTLMCFLLKLLIRTLVMLPL